MDCSTCITASCEDCPLAGRSVKNLTRGRRKRARKPGAGTAVKVKGHTRTPRGPNRGKSKVIVDVYRRGTASRKKKKRKK